MYEIKMMHKRIREQAEYIEALQARIQSLLKVGDNLASKVGFEAEEVLLEINYAAREWVCLSLDIRHITELEK